MDKLDTSQTRERILKKIRALQHRPDSYKAQEQDGAHQYMAEHPAGPMPKTSATLVDDFITQALRLLCTLDRVDSLHRVPQAIAGYLAQQQLSTHLSVWPSLAHLPWDPSGLSVRFGAPEHTDLVGVSGVLCAIAETGTLALASGPDTPASTHLLPETHIAVLHEDQIVQTMEQAFARVRTTLGHMPRALNLVSGPSRTADIEQTIVLGAHGPYRVHVIVVGAPHGGI